MNDEALEKSELAFLAGHIREVGFEIASKHGLIFLKHAFTLYFSNLLKILKIRALHAGRGKVTVIDILKMKQFEKEFEEIHKFIRNIRKRKENIIETQETVEDKKEEKFIISTQIDKYVHIYEHLPPFPPSHTFRRTITKDHIEYTCENLKKRIEESLKAEKNLLKMMNISKYVNFLYQNKN